MCCCARLTERPPADRRRPSPYTAAAAAAVALRLCAALRLRRVVLAGHADGATVALLAAALASRCAARAVTHLRRVKGEAL